VLDLLTQLKANSQDSEARYDEDEANNKRNYEEMVASLESEYERLLSEEAVLREHIAKMTECVETEQAVYDEASAKFDRNTQLLEDSHNLCTSWEEQYQTETQNRNEELSTIADLRAIVSKRFNEMSSGVATRADQDQFDAYKNSYEYDAYKKYESAETTYDEKGAKGAGFVRDTSLED